MDNVTKRVGYGGAAWWGKSYLGVSWLWTMCYQYPGTKWFIGRNELKRIRATTYPTYLKFCREYNIPASQKWGLNMQDNVIRFQNWSEIWLLDLEYAPRDPMYERFGSFEFTGWWVEESGEVHSDGIEVLLTRIGRHMNEEYGLIPKLLETFNPNKGHVYSDFYKPYKDNTLAQEIVFIPAVVTDNPKISKEYIQNLRDLKNKVMQERLLYWNFEYDDTPGRLYAYDDLVDMRTNPINNGEKYIVCDPARLWEDRAVFMIWDGREVKEIIVYEKCLLTTLEEEMRKKAQLYQINMSRVLVDADGLGAGIPDHLGCKGFQNWASPISTDEQDRQGIKPIFENLKTQCYFELQKHIRKIRVHDTRRKELIIQELDVMCQIDMDKDGKTKLIQKEKVKEKLWRSPNFADCIAMRCMFELNPPSDRSDFGFYTKGGW